MDFLVDLKVLFKKALAMMSSWERRGGRRLGFVVINMVFCDWHYIISKLCEKFNRWHGQIFLL